MPAVRLHRSFENEASAPAMHLALVTPSDTEDLAFVTRAISIATAGDIKVTTSGGETLVIPSGSLGVGGPQAIEVARVWATGTTATGIVAWW